MKRRRVIPLFVLLLVAGAVFYLIWHRNHEPEYKGKSISYWFNESFKYKGHDRTGSRALAEAARAIGEPAVSFLLRQTQYRQGFIKTKWVQLAEHLPEFVQRFSSHAPPEDEVRATAYGALADMWATSAVPKLSKVFQLPSNDPATSDHIQHAIWVFQRFGPEAKDAVPDLISFLGGQLNTNKNEHLLADAIQALQEIGPGAKAAVPLLLREVEKGSGQPRVAAALALWSIDGQTNFAVQILESALEDKIDYTVVVAIRGLREIEAPNDVVVPKMIKLLDHAGRQVRYEAAVTLTRRGTAAAAAVPRLVELIRDADHQVQSQALSALAKIRAAPEVIRAFAQFLLDSNQSNSHRAEVARHLGEFGTEAIAAVPSLIEALTDQDETLQLNAAFALWRIDQQQLHLSLPTLVARVKGANEYLVSLAAFYLGQMGPAAAPAIPALEQALLDRRFIKSSGVTDQLKTALERIKGDQPTRP